jgi:protein-tyrosine-phosphatase
MPWTWRPRPSCSGTVTELLVLCTGNASRSVMAGFMLAHLKEEHGRPDLHVVTAGTHTIDGQPMGLRTRTALMGIPELDGDSFSGHRSTQVSESDLVRAELVVVMEADHVRFVRRQFPAAAARTASIRRLCQDLAPAPPHLAERVASLHLGDAILSDHDDVTDPAGHDADVYAACATQLWALCGRLITLV